MNNFPTLNTLWKNEDEGEKNKKEKHKRKRGGKRNAYFCIVLSYMWWEKIHGAVKRLRKDHGLIWIWVRMYYHPFT